MIKLNYAGLRAKSTISPLHVNDFMMTDLELAIKCTVFDRVHSILIKIKESKWNQ